jgi:predicted small secreted protein
MKLLPTRPVLVLAAIALAVTGCKGPAQKVGAGIDDAAGKVKDAVTPPGPVEKTGRAIDRAVGK